MEALNVDRDAFSDGQIGSKLWLCEILEGLQLTQARAAVIWILGGWYGLLAFLIFSRGRLQPRGIRSFDQDPLAEPIADRINNHWEIQDWKFKAHTLDVNFLDFTATDFGDNPSIVVNTSCEHFASLDWWHRIPPGTLVVLQATDMRVPDHISCVESLDEFRERFSGWADLRYAGQKSFAYPNFAFTRYMLIGFK